MENNIFISVIMPICLAAIMFGMGTTLKFADFQKLNRTPRALIAGLVMQLALLPLMGLFTAYWFNLSPTNSIGVIILCACAGGPVSNLLCYLAKADVALSITLTSLSCLTTIFTIPILINFAIVHFSLDVGSTTLPIGATNLKLFLLTVLPVIAGMYLNYRAPSICQKTQRPISFLSLSFFLLIVIGMIAKQFDQLVAVLPSLGLAALSLNLGALAISYALATCLKLSHPQRVCITLETGLQNSATGIFIGATLLSNIEYAVFPAVYAVVMMLSAAVITFGLMRTHGADKHQIALGLRSE